MFNLICAGIIALLGSVGVFVFPYSETHTAGYILFGISFVWLFSSFVNNLVFYQLQIERFEDIRRELRSVDLLIEKQTKLMSEFKIYLADKYPEIEKEIYKMITESQSDIHVVLNYPELKSSKTLMKLVEQINSLADDVYKGKSDLEYSYARVRGYNNNLWFYLKPSVPEDIKKLL